ncbi:hypothetical protein P3H15_45225 [Rhodococcus sp. T2V]|uniref:hypothetical protein n=1 Tax=Rhodococcus sp. T2V TaxID=3034164 RepID=UPI0023E2E3ED|nr:hypothetical protein [Rhodococcus sp. T2V]MDF3312176.1 hypothetical protein [Rhodococcus sp. T2V]
MIQHDRNTPGGRRGRVVDAPWRTAAADGLGSRIDEPARPSRTAMTPTGSRPPLTSHRHRGEDLLPLTPTTPTPESDTARRKTLIFTPGLGGDALAGRRTVLLDPTTEPPAGGTGVVRLGRSAAAPESSHE